MPDTALQTSPQIHWVNFAASDTGGVHVQGQDDPATDTALGSDSVEAIERALCATGYPALRSIQVELEGGIAVLWGHVPGPAPTNSFGQ